MFALFFFFSKFCLFFFLTFEHIRGGNITILWKINIDQLDDISSIVPRKFTAKLWILSFEFDFQRYRENVPKSRLIHAVHDLVKNWLLAFQQSKGVSIIVVGVGRNVFRAKRNMYEMAGERGKVLLYPSFDDLPGHLDDIVKATCGKLSLLNCFIFRCV